MSLFSSLPFPPDLLLYGVALIFIYYNGTVLIYNASNAYLTSEYYPNGLTTGYFFGRQIDVSDGQYSFFRSELFLLLSIAFIFLSISFLIRNYTYTHSKIKTTNVEHEHEHEHEHDSINTSDINDDKNNSSESLRLRVRLRLYFYFLSSLCLLLYVSGSCVFWIFMITSLNFLLARLLAGTRLCIPSTWLLNVTVLLANERYQGYSFTAMIGDSDIMRYLDSNRGIFPWQNLFNLTVLRMISYNCDYHWTKINKHHTDKHGNVVDFETHQGTCQHCKQHKTQPCLWWREKALLPLNDFDYLSYIAYLFYIPLYFAGPISTFNSWRSHLSSPSFVLNSPRDLFVYGVRWLINFLLLEFFLHYFYCFAITNSDFFRSLSPATLAMLCYYTLIVIYLKFLVIWRFFRLFSLLDGVEVSENMNRCITNNYRVQAFWRSWHRSFNRWLIRYIFVPCGGSASASGAQTKNKNNNTNNTSINVSEDAEASSLIQPSSSSSTSSSPSSSSSSSSSSSTSRGFSSLVHQLLNILIVFTFVAFWHDRTMQLLMWSWLICLIYVCELTATFLYNTVCANMSAVKYVRARPFIERNLIAVGGAIITLLMTAANLVGYSVGIGGTRDIVSKIINEGGVQLAGVVAIFYVAVVQFMIQVRVYYWRQGKDYDEL